MNITCCCNNKDLRWFNNGKNFINISSDLIYYKKYKYSSCPSGKVIECFGDFPNESNSSSYTATLKSRTLYSVSKNQSCSPYLPQKICNQSQYNTIMALRNNQCKCVCTPKF